MPVYTQNRGSGIYGTLPQRTLDYLARGAGADSHARNNELHAAAQQFKAAGYSLAETEARLLPIALNDGLPESEARRTIASGFASDQVNDRIGRQAAPSFASNPFGGNYAAAPPPAPEPKAKVTVLPAPIKNGFVALLTAAFLPGEGVSISGIEIDADGGRHPGRGEVLAREKQIERAERLPGGINQAYNHPDGAYIRVNPMAFGGAGDRDVTNYRHCLVEFDLDGNGHEIPKVDQYQAIIDSPFPVSAVLDSGGKSIHAWPRLDAGNDLELFKRRREIVYAYFAAWHIDPKNKNPSRYSRCPEINRNLYDGAGVVIGVGRQELLAVNIGPASWAEFEANQAKTERERVSAILKVQQIADLPATAHKQLIAGVLYCGGKMSLGAGSKAKKSWNLQHLIFCIANGIDYLGFPVLSGPVLLLDYELFGFEIRQRFEAIAKVYNLGGDPFHNISVIALRGQEYLDLGNPVVFDVIAEKIIAGAYVMFSFDPLGKALSGYDENSNSDVIRVLRPFERLTFLTLASFVYCQHYSKGDQTTKDPIDRIAGAGGFGRDPDCLAMFTKHKSPDCYTVNIVERSFPPIDPFVVRWAYPVYRRDDSLDPEDLAPARKRATYGKAATQNDLIMAVLKTAEATGGLAYNQILNATNIPNSSLDRRLKALIKAGEIIHVLPDKIYQLSSKNATKWKAQNHP